jgi:SOS-response transcriptional repressor LexA
MEPLTKTQHETLIFITQFKIVNGYMPSHQELADGLDISMGGSVSQRLMQLFKKGYLRKTGRVRGYELIEPKI